MKRNALFLMILFCTASCEKSFVKTKSASEKIIGLEGSPLVGIKSYNVSYNPESDGFIKLYLVNGAEYEAKAVDGGSFISIKSLLDEPKASFDTVRREIVLEKFNN